MTEQEKMIDLVTEVRDNCYCQAQDYEDPLLFEKARILDSAVEALQKIRWIPCMEKCRRSERGSCSAQEKVMLVWQNTRKAI